VKPAELTLKLPFREKKFRNLKEAMRHGIYSRPGGKNAETLAMEAGLDRLSDLSRYVGDNPDDPRGRFLDIFIPLLIAMGEKGVEVHDYIGEEIRAAQEQGREDDEAAANRIIREYGPAVFEALKVKAGKR
jgi:hypothetical protein